MSISRGLPSPEVSARVCGACKGNRHPACDINDEGHLGRECACPCEGEVYDQGLIGLVATLRGKVARQGHRIEMLKDEKIELARLLRRHERLLDEADLLVAFFDETIKDYFEEFTLPGPYGAPPLGLDGSDKRAHDAWVALRKAENR